MFRKEIFYTHSTLTDSSISKFSFYFSPFHKLLQVNKESGQATSVTCLSRTITARSCEFCEGLIMALLNLCYPIIVVLFFTLLISFFEHLFNFRPFKNCPTFSKRGPSFFFTYNFVVFSCFFMVIQAKKKLKMRNY
jgi:hypothetical protein